MICINVLPGWPHLNCNSNPGSAKCLYQIVKPAFTKANVWTGNCGPVVRYSQACTKAQIRSKHNVSPLTPCDEPVAFVSEF